MTQVHGTLVSLQGPEYTPAAALPDLSLTNMLKYANKEFRLYDAFKGLHDSRGANCVHPFMNVMVPLFLMPLMQFESMNDFFHAKVSMTLPLKHALPRRVRPDIDPPSRDTAERVAAGLSCDELRGVLKSMINTDAVRNAAVAGAVDGIRLGIVDGHELSSSTKKFCEDHCLTRKLKDGTTEYFHKAVLLSLIAGAGHLILDYELLSSRDPGEKDEGELTGFKRICERLLEADGDLLFDALAGDALYCCAPCINLILKLKVAGFLRLKGDNRKLIRQADELFDHGRGKSISFYGENRKGERVLVVMYYDDHFRMKGVDQDLRVVRILEIPVLKNGRLDTRTDKDGKPLREEKTAYMVCTDTSMPIQTIWKVCHLRWDVESCIHQLVNYYHIDHLFSHKAIEQILILTFVAYNLREMYLCFHRARDFIGRHYTRKDFTRKLFVDLCSKAVGRLFRSGA